jgi:membrane-associated phospholipid phosphatase
MTERAEPTFASRARLVLSRIGSHLAAWMSTLLRPPQKAAARLQPLWPATRPMILTGVVLLVLVLGAMAALDWWVDALALRILPHWVLAFFAFITDYGKSGWFLWPIGLLLLLIAAVSYEVLSCFSQLVLAALVVRLGFIFLAIALPGLFTTIIKRIIGRARPYFTNAANPFLYAPFNWHEPYTSLPSGHATNVFATAIAVGAVWPQTRVVMWIYAGFIAVSRVVLAAHYPSDVIAGAIVGTLGALWVRRWFAARRLGFAVGADGSIHALTPPSWRRLKRVAAQLLAE